ncbi:MAG: sugar phosphate isomerase/epimerase, partial [Planctomycetaceae bacterium]|nr:sugar phosphate isomerase/epimerase [Planctomycetaceae bacterium]
MHSVDSAAQSRRLSRRDALAASAAGILTPWLTAAPGLATSRSDDLTENELCVFTKPFQSLSPSELANTVAEMGFTGLELPVRPGGHIEPEEVEDRLPAMVEALAARQLKVTVLTSGINDPRDPLTERVLRTAAAQGIRFYRMNYFRYDPDRPILPQIETWKQTCTELADMNRQFGISGVYQNHAGRNYFGASLWDLQRALETIDPQHIGVAYDIRHATVEGGMNWPVTFAMIRPHVTVVYVKDFQW